MEIFNCGFYQLVTANKLFVMCLSNKQLITECVYGKYITLYYIFHGKLIRPKLDWLDQLCCLCLSS